MQPSQLIFLGNKVLDDPAHGCPRPCRKGNLCSYSGYCSFVHPGEQGMVRKFFPAHTIQKDGCEMNVRARVILCASDIEGRKRPHYAPYYQRKEQQLSWPAWMKQQGLTVSPGPLPAWEQPKCIRVSYITGQVSDSKEFLYTTQEERLDALESMIDTGDMASIDAFYSETKSRKASKESQENCVKGVAAMELVDATPTTAAPVSLSYASIAASTASRATARQQLLALVQTALHDSKEAMPDAEFQWTATLHVQVTDEIIRTHPFAQVTALLADPPAAAKAIFSVLDRFRLAASPVATSSSNLGWGDEVCA